MRSVRLTKKQLAAIERAAAVVGMKPAGFIADAAVAVATAEGGPKSWLLDQRGKVEELMAASAQLARVGNNLNQIARTLNSGGQAPYAQAVITRVLQVAARVEEAAIEVAGR